MKRLNADSRCVFVCAVFNTFNALMNPGVNGGGSNGLIRTVYTEQVASLNVSTPVKNKLFTIKIFLVYVYTLFQFLLLFPCMFNITQYPHSYTLFLREKCFIILVIFTGRKSGIDQGWNGSFYPNSFQFCTDFRFLVGCEGPPRGGVFANFISVLFQGSNCLSVQSKSAATALENNFR